MARKSSGEETKSIWPQALVPLRLLRRSERADRLGQELRLVEKKFLEYFTEIEDPQDIICLALETEEIRGFLKKSEQLYENDVFDNIARLGLLRTTAFLHGQLQQFLSFRGPNNYTNLVKASNTFHAIRTAFTGSQPVVM